MLLRYLPPVFFVLSIFGFLFLGGVYVGHKGYYPTQVLRDASATIQSIAAGVSNRRSYVGEFVKFSTVPLNAIAAERVKPLISSDRNAASYLMFGGLNQNLDLCPEFGCLAIVVGANGEVLHAYPYRPREIFAANITNEYTYEYRGFDPTTDSRPIGIERFENGDLLVVFQLVIGAQISPYGTGIARFDLDGHPRWFRFDFSHHWPAPGVDDEILVPGTRVDAELLKFSVPDGDKAVRCFSGRPFHDVIRVLRPDGQLLREVSAQEAILNSPHRAILSITTNGCDPLHLNFIDRIRPGFPDGLFGIRTGDWVISLRNLSAFAILDARTGKLKHLQRGSFLQQHSVQHVAGSRFLIFDNLGSDGRIGPSRLIELDLATGSERTVFPSAEQKARLGKSYSEEAGQIAISADRLRALVNFSYQGVAYEVRLSDGAALTKFTNLVDASSVQAFDADQRAENAAIYKFYGMTYLPADTAAGN